MKTLRPYQERAVAKIHKLKRATLAVSPTGSGKTVIAAQVILDAVAAGKRVLFLAHTSEIIDQTSKQLTELGIEHGIIMAKITNREPHRLRPDLPVQVASFQTLSKRKTDPFDVIIVDEAHRIRGASYRRIIRRSRRRKLLGLTATPWRSDGRGMGKVFKNLVVVATPRELLDLGYLVPCSGFTYDSADLTGVETKRGDYKVRELGERCLEAVEVMGDIVSKWVEQANGVPTILYGASVAHSQELARRFNAVGVRVEHLDGTTPIEERLAILERLRSGETKIVCNYGVLTEGFDFAATGCIIVARPTRSEGLHLQMMGRGLRPVCIDCRKPADPRLPACPSCGSTNLKRTVLIHDHAGNILAHGMPEDERDYSLKRDETDKKWPPPPPPVWKICSVCRLVYSKALDACPGCGVVTFWGEREIKEHFGAREIGFDSAKCSFDMCERRAEALGFCRAHYYQNRSGKDLKPILVKPLRGGICTTPDCGEPRTVRDFCMRHYRQWKAGKSFTFHKSKVARNCSFNGCDKNAHSRGLCHGHYDQLMRGAELRPILTLERKPCAFVGCGRMAAAKGLCRAHRSQERSGVPLAPIGSKIRKACSFSGCARLQNSHGLCNSHVRQMKKGATLRPIIKRVRGTCPFEGCGRPQGAKGLCSGHYAQRRRGSQLSPIKILPKTKICAMPLCNSEHLAKGLCAKHYEQKRSERRRRMGSA